ncbi:MAG: hypothetical protein J6F30_00275 [Cellulosilyticum sp.]|nr:hypothetical protein [Cellulosilyticum sp.]
METFKETLKNYKWTLLAGVIVAVLIALITANLHVLRFLNYKIQGNVEGVFSILQSQIKNEDVQDDWFFEQGMQYLLEQEEYSEELTSFFEEQFTTFNVDWKKQIIKAYNAKNLKLTMSKELMDILVEYIDEEGIKDYVSKLSVTDFEQGLVLVYGNNPTVDNAFIESLYKVLSIYPEKLSFEKFTFNLYDVLSYTGENPEEKVQLIISKVNTEVAKENIFKQLRTQPLTEEELCKWVEFFNTTQIITADDYTAFKKSYENICLFRKQYSALDDEEIQLKNQKAAVEAQIGDKIATLETKKSELQSLQTEVGKLESTLDRLVSYSDMNLYIEKASGTGSNEYIASTPRNGLFGMKPSYPKYIVKLTSTSFNGEGVYDAIPVYYQGIKSGTNGDEYGYYVEVSSSDINSIDEKMKERDTKTAQLNSVKSEVSQIENEINTIKKEGKYDETQEALNAITAQRNEYSTKINEEIVNIRKLFGFTNITIELTKA